MDILFILAVLLAWVFYMLASADRPLPSEKSLFELKRGAGSRNSYRLAIEREEQFKNVYFLHQLVVAILFALAIILTLLTFEWLWGIIFVALAILVTNIISTQKVVTNASAFLLKKVEPLFVRFSKKWPKLFGYVGKASIQDTDRYRKIHSKDELIRLLHSSPEALTDTEKKIISSSLVFSTKKVKTIMTPRKKIKSVPVGEFLGPIALDELHNLGHSRLPVIDGDLDHIVGILYIRDLLSLDVKHSATAGECMEKKVYYIDENDTLDQALVVFLKVKHHLLVVTNKNSETVGVLSLEDVIEELIGYKIVDEDDRLS